MRRSTRCAARSLAAVLLDAVPDELSGAFDVIVANAPYVPTGGLPTLPREAREHEPLAALDGGTDGLDVLRRVLGGAERWLAPGGHLVVETSAAQAPRLTDASGLETWIETSEELGATVLVARARPEQPHEHQAKAG